jgi:hypothetical protein
MSVLAALGAAGTAGMPLVAGFGQAVADLDGPAGPLDRAGPAAPLVLGVAEAAGPVDLDGRDGLQVPAGARLRHRTPPPGR